MSIGLRGRRTATISNCSPHQPVNASLHLQSSQSNRLMFCRLQKSRTVDHLHRPTTQGPGHRTHALDLPVPVPLDKALQSIYHLSVIHKIILARVLLDLVPMVLRTRHLKDHRDLVHRSVSLHKIIQLKRSLNKSKLARCSLNQFKWLPVRTRGAV